MRRLLPRGYLFTVLGIAVGVAGLVALGAMAERISGTWDKVIDLTIEESVGV